MYVFLQVKYIYHGIIFFVKSFGGVSVNYYSRIRDLREDSDLTQEQLVELLDMHKTTYTNYEQGKHTVPLDFAVILAKYYNVSLDYIAGLTSDKRGFSYSDLTKEQKELLRLASELSDPDRKNIVSFLKTLINFIKQG